MPTKKSYTVYPEGSQPIPHIHITATSKKKAMEYATSLFDKLKVPYHNITVVEEL